MAARSSESIVVLDTCVLAPMPLCDTLLRMAEDPHFYIPKWSNDILLELRSTLQRMGYSPAQANRRITAMENAFEDAHVVGYAHLVSSMTNDRKDRHVLGAAVRCKANAIVTANVKHFPTSSVRPFGITVLTPDDFLLRHFYLNKELLLEKIVSQAIARHVSLADLLARLSNWAPAAARLIVDL